MKIKITVGDISLTATLSDNETARRITRVLPLESSYNVWGDEFYFSIPVQMDIEEGREIMEYGELGFWPPGNAFCIFFGKTPVSTDERPRAASEVSPFGQIDGDATILRQANAPTIKIEKLVEK
jgi:hypothetical protein